MGSDRIKLDSLVKQALTIRAEEIPAPAFEKARDLFLDIIGCIFAGTPAAGIGELRQTLLYWGGRPQASVLGFNRKTSAPFAALINSATGHARDFDDTHDQAGNHGCVTVLPALLATAETCAYQDDSAEPVPFFRGRVSGRDLIAALAVGLEFTNRLGMAFIPYLHTGWLPTTLWGPFGGAIACGRILKLNLEQMRNALGLAYSQIHGNRQALLEGTLTKRMQPGFSACAGVQAAFLAANNISAARNIISGDFGIPVLYTGGRIDPGYISEGLGSFEETMNISFKPYPSCRCTHAVIDAALGIRKRLNLSWPDIEGGVISLPPNSMGQIGQPFSIRDNPTVDAQFSAQYTAALAFVRGRPGIKDFSAENVVSRHDVAALASLFSTREFEKENPAIGLAKVEIRLRDGRIVAERVDAAKGSPQNPLTTGEQDAKFIDCLDNSVREYSPEHRESILDAIRHIEDFEDVAKFVSLLEGGRLLSEVSETSGQQG
jgi:2-methylcitrate dehydratase PrpD